MNKPLIIAFILIIISQVLAYLQLQSQFFFTWAKEHPIIVAMFGFPISILLIYFTKYCAIAFDGQTWPGRLIGFSVGAIVFALLSHFILNEQFNTKTLICLGLSFLILIVQIFWK